MSTPVTHTLYYPWRIEAGEREVLSFPVLNGTTPFPIPGYTADCKIKDRPGGTVLYTFPAGLAVVSVDGLTVTLTVPPPISLAWTFRYGWWRLKVTEPTPADPLNPNIQRIANGPLLVVPD